MAKLSRESRLRERRVEKKARKEARKLAPAEQPDASEALVGTGEETFTVIEETPQPSTPDDVPSSHEGPS